MRKEDLTEHSIGHKVKLYDDDPNSDQSPEKSKKVHKDPNMESLNLSASQNIQIPVPKELSFSRQVKKDQEYYKITGVNNKNSLSIKPYPRIDLSKYKVNFLLGNPATFITHPATTIEHYSTKVKNLMAKQRHSEVS